MLENINLQQVYLWVSLVSTTLFLIKMVVFLIVGGDAEVETDFDSFADADPSFSFFSVQSILAFLMGCGWMGLAIIEKMKTNPLLAIVITLIVGFIFMTVTAFLMFSVKKLNIST